MNKIQMQAVINHHESQIQELKNTISEITNDSNFHPIKDWAICGICHNSSYDSKGRKTRMETFHKFILLIERAKKII
jgi:hypothetical protein